MLTKERSHPTGSVNLAARGPDHPFRHRLAARPHMTSSVNGVEHDSGVLSAIRILDTAYAHGDERFGWLRPAPVSFEPSSPPTWKRSETVCRRTPMGRRRREQFDRPFHERRPSASVGDWGTNSKAGLGPPPARRHLASSLLSRSRACSQYISNCSIIPCLASGDACLLHSTIPTRPSGASKTASGRDLKCDLRRSNETVRIVCALCQLSTPERATIKQNTSLISFVPSFTGRPYVRIPGTSCPEA